LKKITKDKILDLLDKLVDLKLGATANRIIYRIGVLVEKEGEKDFNK
jgi:dissimilatory sulfite reductase (desulfoviridin) alpha/beta subunit